MMHTESVGFHPRCRVHRVAKEAVARHLETDDAGHDGARVQSDAQLQLVVGSVPDAKMGHGLQQPERHACDLPGVQIAVPYGQARNDHVRIADRLNLKSSD